MLHANDAVLELKLTEVEPRARFASSQRLLTSPKRMNTFPARGQRLPRNEFIQRSAMNDIIDAPELRITFFVLVISGLVGAVICAFWELERVRDRLILKSQQRDASRLRQPVE